MESVVCENEGFKFLNHWWLEGKKYLRKEKGKNLLGGGQQVILENINNNEIACLFKHIDEAKRTVKII